MKRAIVFVSYNSEEELNTFLVKNGTYLEVDAVYEDLDAADVEHIEDVINRDCITEEE